MFKRFGFPLVVLIRLLNYLSSEDVFYLLHYPVFLAVAPLAVVGYETRC